MAQTKQNGNSITGKSDLLAHRATVKSKKPFFLRQDAHKKKKLSYNWRRPKGSDSKMRVSLRGYRRQVRAGWKSPTEVRGLNRTGFVDVLVNNVLELANIDPNTQSVLISGKVGLKKRIAILNEAAKRKLPISNFKSPETYVADAFKKRDDAKKKKQESKQSRDAKREQTKKDAEKKKEKEAKDKKAEETAAPAEAVAQAEEKKLEEKKEKDKLLTAKNQSQ
jgi:large subunit ribosomal protein L32e